MSEENDDLTPLERKKFEKGFLITVSVISILIGVGVIIFFITKVSESHDIPRNNEILNLTSFGAFGDFIAGVAGTLFSLAGFFLLYLTLKDQRENFHKERLESNYFEMIKFHRENVNELTYKYFDFNEFKKLEEISTEKRKVFKIIFAHFKEAWQELNHFFVENDISNIYDHSYLQKLKLNKKLFERDIDLKQYAQIDIIYTIIFYGLSREDRLTIFNIFKNKYHKNFTNQVINYAILKPKKNSRYWEKWSWLSTYSNHKEIFNDIIKQRLDKNHNSDLEVKIAYGEHIETYQHFYLENYSKYYGGHQFRLGHYYRHMFQTVKLIDDEIYLNFNKKYSYVKMLRSQLSNYEQIMFFLNTISQAGRAWEFENKSIPEIAFTENRNLITKYNLIKNIPMEKILNEIEISKYYPLIAFETNFNIEIVKARRLLEIKKYY